METDDFSMYDLGIVSPEVKLSAIIATDQFSAIVPTSAIPGRVFGLSSFRTPNQRTTLLNRRQLRLQFDIASQYQNRCQDARLLRRAI